MSMGCASSCRTFDMFSTPVEWVAWHKLKIDHKIIVHLLDDFLIVSSDRQLCQVQLDLFIDLCSYVGILIATEKTFGPLTTLSFAGIELDSVLMEARLPLDKLNRCSLPLLDFFHCKKATLKEVQSLTGLFNFACSVIVPGRAFLRRLVDLTVGIQCPHHLIRLCKRRFKGLAIISG